MKKIFWLLPVLALFLMGGSEPVDLVRFTIINKSKSDIAIQLNAIPKVCCNKADVEKGEFYYLQVEEGTKENPTVKIYTIVKDTYQMQLFYLSTYDPVYGFKCDPTVPNKLSAGRNLRLVVLPCNEIPTPWSVGEPSMWKYLPFPVPDLARFFNEYWKDRLVY
jgi:hypothetical protein